jgi:tetratricopeptide (TPR) repeat protein
MIDYLIESEKSKEAGNNELKNNQFEKAVDCYTKAIELALSEGSRVPKTKLAIYYANRSFAHIKLENYGLAIPDAESSIASNPEYEKAYLRLAFSQEVLQHYKDAYSAYLKVEVVQCRLSS